MKDEQQAKTPQGRDIQAAPLWGLAGEGSPSLFQSRRNGSVSAPGRTPKQDHAPRSPGKKSCSELNQSFPSGTCVPKDKTRGRGASPRRRRKKSERQREADVSLPWKFPDSPLFVNTARSRLSTPSLLYLTCSPACGIVSRAWSSRTHASSISPVIIARTARGCARTAR